MEDDESHLIPDARGDAADAVRMYLREAGRVSLLTRQGELDVARRIERGQLNMLKALSRSPVVVRELSRLHMELIHGEISIQEIVTSHQDEWTESKAHLGSPDGVGRDRASGQGVDETEGEEQ